MSDWSDGYVTNIDYNFGYYLELNPQNIPLAFLDAGLAAPENVTACELGFGQGVSVNIHAAASDTRWFGTDFNSAQAGFARALAAVSGAGAQLVDQPFAEFCNRPDLPDFDYIGLHGIWSWISDQNRAVIIDFIRRKLAVGGVLYVGYNTQPGLAAMVPMRELLSGHAEVMGAPGHDILTRIDAALAFAERLLATNPLYARANPHVAARLTRIKKESREYLAHEYFGRHWLPMPFSRMAEWLAPARLSYACSARFLDHIDALNLSGEQQALLAEIPDVVFRETVRDFVVNQNFRRDYWVRGARRLNALEQAEARRAVQVLLAQPRADVPLKVAGSAFEATMHEGVYGAILDTLADHQPRTLGQIEQAVMHRGIPFAQLFQAVLTLTGTGSLVTVQDQAKIARARTQTDKLNAFLCDRARGSNEISVLASPVSGGGVMLNRLKQLFLLARKQGKERPAEWAEFVWQVLAPQGHKLIKDGKTLESTGENIAELAAQAQAFNDQHLPMLKALRIA